VISIDNMGALPLKIFRHAPNISGAAMLGFGLAVFIRGFDACEKKHDARVYHQCV
jgi:hypothetical protein